MAGLRPEDFLFHSRLSNSIHLSTRQYARIVHAWVSEIGLETANYGTHTLRRNKASLIYRRSNGLPSSELQLVFYSFGADLLLPTIRVYDANSLPICSGI